MRGRVIAVAAISMLAAACTGSSGSSSDSAPTTTQDGAPAPPTSAGGVPVPAPVVPDGPAIADDIANGLVIVFDLDGGSDRLVSYQADGTIVASYVDESDGEIWQPIWSPDGRRVAWTRTIDGSAWELVTAAVDGSARTVHPLPGRPDYITYDPTASRVLALTPSPDGFGLVIVDLDADDGSPSQRPIDVGRPYFSDFSPEGDRVIAHVGSDMRVVDLAGEMLPLDFTSIGHQTPSWHPSDDTVFLATDDETGNRLISHALTSASTSELATFAAFLLFDVDPSGARLAVSALGPDDDGSVVALRSSAGRAQPATLGGGLWLIDVADGATTRLADDPTVAPMWDPTGERVLIRTTVGGTGRWIAYGVDGSETGTEDFDVAGTLLSAYLPFWDQYTRSQTLWSPDGGQFVHVGRSAAGASGVWIHDAATSGRSSFLADGDLAFWSPT